MTSCYIEATPGAAYSIRLEVAPDSQRRSDEVNFRVHVDGGMVSKIAVPLATLAQGNPMESTIKGRRDVMSGQWMLHKLELAEHSASKSWYERMDRA